MQVERSSRAFQSAWAGGVSAGAVRRHDDLPGLILVECGGGGNCGWNALAVGLTYVQTGKDINTLAMEAATLGKSLRTLVQFHVRRPEYAAQYGAARVPPGEDTTS
eukprot:8461906-Alexandrium_andersonii.AAC.1